MLGVFGRGEEGEWGNFLVGLGGAWWGWWCWGWVASDGVLQRFGEGCCGGIL